MKGGSTGATGGSTGGSTSGSTGGSTGSTTGGSTAKPNGGSTGSSSGGSTGSSTGGSTGGSTGNTNGGSTATGGTQSGGSQTGGSPTTGGAPAPASALVTSANGAYWKTETFTEAASGNADVTVNDTSPAQDWEGFGGAFNEMGWNYLSTKAMQDEAINLLFGANAANFAWGRIPMGASDYAMDRYTYAETANDTSLSSFSIARDKEKILPFIKAALAVKSDIHFWASPWTPPTWMKTPAGFDGGKMKSDEETLKVYAQYFIKFIQAYNQEGIKIDVVAPQNEPNFAQGYPSCLWDAATFTTFIGKHLGPAIASANLPTTIMLGTMSNALDNADFAIASAVMGDSAAKSYVKVIGAQWDVLLGVSKLKGYNLPIWVSEHRCGNYPWDTANYKSKAPNDFAYGVESWGHIKNAIKSGITSYNAWNMVLDENGKGIDKTRDWAQNALLVAGGGKITPTPAYYVFRHFSQFANPGGKVVGTTGGDAIAFKNSDGSLVAVMYNSGGAKAAFTVAIGGKKLQFPMPGNGWATIKVKP
jgi:glucosylceramidase